MKGFFILILFCCVQNITASGRPDVDNTLDTLIVTALRNNPDLKAVGFSSRSAEFKTGAAGKLPDPQLSFGLLNLPRSSFSFDETPMSGMSVGLKISFVRFERVIMSIRTAPCRIPCSFDISS